MRDMGHYFEKPIVCNYFYSRSSYPEQVRNKATECPSFGFESRNSQCGYPPCKSPAEVKTWARNDNPSYFQDRDLRLCCQRGENIWCRPYKGNMDSKQGKPVGPHKNGRRRKLKRIVSDKPHLASRSIGRLCNGLEMLNAMVARLHGKKSK